MDQRSKNRLQQHLYDGLVMASYQQVCHEFASMSQGYGWVFCTLDTRGGRDLICPYEIFADWWVLHEELVPGAELQGMNHLQGQNNSTMVPT